MTPRESTLDPVIGRVQGGPVVRTPTGQVRWNTPRNMSFTSMELRAIATQMETLEVRQES